MKTLIQTLFNWIASRLRERWHLSLEYLALRHQLEVLKRSAKRGKVHGPTTQAAATDMADLGELMPLISTSTRSTPNSLADYTLYPQGFFGSLRPVAIGFGDGSRAGDSGVYAVTGGLLRHRLPPTWRQWSDL